MLVNKQVLKFNLYQEYLSFNVAKYDLTNSKPERLLSYSPG